MLEVFSGAIAMSEVIEIRSGVELPSNREPIELITQDGLKLIGELAMPVSGHPVATLITLHPLPTHGGFMDSHVLRKAANRLPHLANLAVLRFNTRGTTSPHGTSDGQFGEGVTEAADVAAAVDFAISRGLPNLWLLGWSFGTELALKYGPDHDIKGAILLSPPLHRTSDEELARWNGSGKKLFALVPEFDDYLQPEAAQQRFAGVEDIEVIGVDGAKHLWVGEAATTRVLNEIVKVVNPAAYPLPETVSL
jgi:alpha/beta superfamily hydrolase